MFPFLCKELKVRTDELLYIENLYRFRPATEPVEIGNTSEYNFYTTNENCELSTLTVSNGRLNFEPTVLMVQGRFKITDFPASE